MRTTAIWVACMLAAGCAARPPTPPAQPGEAAAPARPAVSSDRRAAFAEARDQLGARQYEAAAASFEMLLPAYPELEDYCLRFLAESRAGRGDTAAAADAWERLLERHPQSIFAARARLERGRLLAADGDLVDAERLIAAARDRGDDEVARQASLALADIAAARGAAAEAAAHLAAARRTGPGTATARRAKQRLLALWADHPELAPSRAALESETRLRLAERDYDGARRAADAWLAAADPAQRPQALRLRADAEHGAGDFDAGLATLQEIVRQYPAAPAAPEAQFRHASLLWNRDRNQEAAEAFAVFRRRYPHHPRTPEARYALARIDQGDDRPAAAAAGYAALAAAHPDHPLAREARWRIGWLHYRDGSWREAAAAFATAAGGAGAGGAPDAHYWRARALERGGDSAGAAEIYQAIATQSPGSYYALWATRRLGISANQRPAVAPAAPAAPTTLGPAAAGADPYHWVRANELLAIGWSSQARSELRAFEMANGQQSAVLRSLPAAYQAVGGYRDAIRLATAHGGGDPAISYPLAFWPHVTRAAAAHDVDPLLVVALMRQESLFDPTARSPADARGLMQLLPSTAERVARERGIAAPAGRLYDPEVNLALGVAYLDALLRRTGGPLKALAAYNGGEAALAKWEERFGGLEQDEFVESITYRETRDYVKKVMGNYRRYQQLYGAP